MGVDLVSLVINGLAGIGALTAIQGILGTIFHPTSSTADPLASVTQMLGMMMQMQMLPMIMSMFKPPSSDGGIGNLLVLIGPIIAIVLILVLLKKKL